MKNTLKIILAPIARIFNYIYYNLYLFLKKREVKYADYISVFLLSFIQLLIFRDVFALAKHFEMKTKPPKDLGMIAFMLFWFCVINYMVYIRKNEWRENLKACEEDGPIKKKLRVVSASALVAIIIFIFIFFALYKSPDVWHIALVKFLSVW